MPTPESEAFLAKKPQVPPTFDGVDYEDTKRLKQAQDAIIREQWVQVMMGRLVREELSKCYYREGVNHLEKCGRLRERYLQLLSSAKVRGYLFEQQNYITKNRSAAAAAAVERPGAAVRGCASISWYIHSCCEIVLSGTGSVTRPGRGCPPG
ncbi:hypothetical protein VTH06DRAFT_4256 [Thermothelomyces fergusii]